MLSRQGLQFLPDVAGVLARLHAFLKPRGRLAAAVWGQPTAVQFAAPVPVIRAELDLPPLPRASVPGPFALGVARQLRQFVSAAGFADVETGTVTAIYELASPELATRWLRDVAPPISSLVNERPSDVQERYGKGSPRRGSRTRPPTAGCGSRMRRFGSPVRSRRRPTDNQRHGPRPTAVGIPSSHDTSPRMLGRSRSP